MYGNVLYRFADAGTPLSWSVDHLFPVARGGLSNQPQLRIVQSQAHINKADRWALVQVIAKGIHTVSGLLACFIAATR